MSNRICGRVVLTESGAGIPDVLVVAYDADLQPRTDTGPVPSSTPSAASPDLTAADRLGSVLTRADGVFELSYEDEEFQARDRQDRRPALVLEVRAPENRGEAAELAVLHVSQAPRVSAGRTEHYLIRVSSEQLARAGVVPPSSVPRSAEPAQSIVGRLREAGARTSRITDGIVDVARQRVEAYRATFGGFDARMRLPLVNALSSIPPSVIDQERLVRSGESPLAKNEATIKRSVRETLNSSDPAKRAPARGFITLSRPEVDELQPLIDQNGTVPESAVRTIAARKGRPASTTYVQRAARLPLCRPRTPTEVQCAEILDESAPDPIQPNPGPGVPGPGTSVVTLDDVPRFIARLMDPLTAPEEQLLTGLTPAATQETVGSNVQGLVFEPSPADVPTFHDFHSLQIAFEHVWQEAIDQGVLQLAEHIYETVVELGGDPHRTEHEGRDPLQALRSEARLALHAIRPAPAVATTPAAPGASSNGQVEVAARTWSDVFEGLVEIVGEGSGSGGGATEQPDPGLRLPALLAELERRLHERYAFTVYAANHQERSINFGILNTFRQIWTPLSYQAGPLVKSIPLAPKQTQKVVITRKTSKKRALKELENNVRVLKDETSQSSRAEQEIARRASRKSEFEHSSSSGSELVGAETTTTFKQDATKSTDDVKKSFRESVVKVAEELKNERITEINTEETESFESTETTEISNQNDEIAVSFLFYELERRYRLHERLHRIRPVVLVAQEFPEPQQIDQAWLVAHDWILRRSILDDSFLPTLATISQAAGAETAIAEMRVNIAQQRQIVHDLQEELKIAHEERAVIRRSVWELLFPEKFDEKPREALKDNADQIADRVRDLMFRLEREVTALNALLESYTKALQAHHTHLTEIARLRVHVKDNIFYYMQAIWLHEPPDQRYFRLHNVPLPTLRATGRIKIDFGAPFTSVAVQPHLTLPRFGAHPDVAVYPTQAVVDFSDRLERVPLCEVADLDDLLGFKGNYMIFPLKESNPLTDFMMAPYIDQATGELLDPSDPVGWSLDEFAEYVCCLKEHLTAQEFARIRPQLREQHRVLLSAPRRTDDVIVVPTNSLFIEALPAQHSLIEKFKRDHRMEDVKKAQAEVREKELENIRRAARLLAGEREDPNIDRHIQIDGAVQGVVVPTPEP